jgi:uncharacterized LabA/DUF88 family protein
MNRNDRRKAGRDDPFQSNEFKDWTDTMRKRLIPKMRDSATVLMIAPDMSMEFDIQFALQIGASILLEKPLILLVQSDRTIPPKLRAIADRIIETDLDEMTMDSEGIQKQLKQAFDDFGKQ